MLKLKMFKVSELKDDPENPNEVSKEKMAALEFAMEELEKQGLQDLDPILVQPNKTIIDGHHRKEIYKKIGREEIPGFEVDTTDIQRRLIRQTMNKNRGQHNDLKMR